MRERAVRGLDALLAGFAEGAFVVGADGRIALWNRGAERILGSTAREVLGQPCHEAFGGCDAGGRRLCHQQCQATRHTAPRNGIASFELETRTRAGRPCG